MPSRDFLPYYDEEGPFEPPPSAPPPTGGGTPGGEGVGVVPDPGSGGAPPPPAVPTGGGGGFGGGGGTPGLGPVPPMYPNIRIPGAPQFVAPQWTAPTMDQAVNEPGYAMRLAAGRQAMERSAAAKGLLRTGGTLTDLTEYGQNFGAQEYQNVYNRALGAYDRSYRAAHDAFAPRLQQWQLGAEGGRSAQLARYQAELSQWLQANQPRSDPGPPPFDEEEPQPPPSDLSGYSYGDPWTDNRLSGDPWTDAPSMY